MKFKKKHYWIIGLLCACSAHAVGFTLQTAQQQEAEGWAEMPAILARINPPAFPDKAVDLTDFGGTGDGTSDNRQAFQRAIAFLVEQGGGKLTVPPGIYWVDGPIVMQSAIHLEVQKGATIRFSSNPASYLPAVKQRWEGTVCYNYSPLIRGHNLTHVALTGEGTIDGAGVDWAHSWKEKQDPDKAVLRRMGNDKVPEERRVFGNGFLDLDGDGKDDGHGDGQPHYLRPPLIQFYECEGILLEGLTLTGSPFWTVHPVFCRNVIGRNLRIISDSPNDDGFDPDSCEDVLIEDCVIDTRDDAIAIKAGRDQDAWDRPSSRNIIIRNNILQSGANALCIGSEMSGGVETVFAENNTIPRAGNALKFKCNLDRGGFVRSIFIRDTIIDSCRQSLLDFTTDYHGYRGGNFPVAFHDFHISGITCKETGRAAFEINGVESRPIERVYLNNIHVEKARQKLSISHAEGLIFRDVIIDNEAVNGAFSVATAEIQAAPPPEFFMVNVREKDTNRTGQRYYEEWEQKEARTIANLADYTEEDIPIGRYNDRTDISLEKTGFYYATKMDDKWWVVSPDGHPLVHIAINSLNLRASDRVLFTYSVKYETPERWADDAISLLQRYGFHGAGSWGDVEQIISYNERNNERFSYCVQLSMVDDYKASLDKSRGYAKSNKLFPVFDPGFEAYCEMRASELVAYRDDPNLFGYFFDNELTFARDMLDRYLGLPKEDVGYAATVEWLARKNLTADSELTDPVRDEFRAFVLDRYYRIISTAIRKYDPNHLLLGNRFYWNDRIYFDDNQSAMLTNPLVFQVAGKYLDILSCNYYFRWTPVKEEINAWTEWSGKPFMITEWYVKGDDTGLPNMTGAGAIVGTQKERGWFYQQFALKLLESPNCVGWHWFRYQDKGEWGQYRNSNKGVVDYDFKPYYTLLEKMDELNRQVYSLRDHF